jgi:hypothetical protein
MRELQERYHLICAWTKQIKDEGQWVPIEDYLVRHFKLNLTHGISPAGIKKLLDEQAGQPPPPPPA